MTDERLEGSGAAQLVQVIRKFGKNTDVRIELATVTSAPPTLKIQVDGMTVELETVDLIVFEHLTARTETVDIGGLLGSRVITYPNRLQVGDRVIVSETNKGQTFIILDKAVTF